VIYDRQQILSEWVRHLPISQQEDWIRRRRACDKSLYLFIKDAGGYTPKSGGDISVEIHKPICDSWQDPKVLRQFVFMPRFWRKSTALTIWGNLWEYLQNPEVRILIPSEKQDTAAKWIMQIGNQALRNARLRWLYPELLLVDDSWIKQHRWSSLYLEFPRNGIYPEATIECTGIRGAAQGGHYDVISPDDLVGEKGMESEMVLADATRWFDNIEELLIQPSLNAPDASRVHGTGTHWSPGDLGEYIQENYPEYKWFIVPARKTSNQPKRENIVFLNNPKVAEGESNFPAGGTTEYYVSMAANPAKEIQYWAQHMNMPTGASKMTKFDYNWLRWYTIESRVNQAGGEDEYIVCDDKVEFKLKEIQKYGFIDPGGFAEMKVITRGSRNALLVAGQPETSVRKFVFEAWAGRLKEPQEFLDRLFGFHDKWKCRMWRIETIAAQKYIYKDIIEERRRKNKALPLMELDPDVGKDAKDARITALIDPISRGEYFLHKSMKDLISEVKSYPGGMTKDLVDMLSCYAKTYGKRREQEKREIPPPRMVVRDEGIYEDGASEVCGY
jgi:hypothetical protein